MVATSTNLNRVDWHLWKRFWAIAKPYWFSNEKWGARGLLAILLGLVLVNSGQEVLFSYMNRDLFNALQDQDIEAFFHTLWMFAGVFVLAIPLNVFSDYVQRKLALYWRRWLTNHFLSEYFHNRAYYRLNSDPNIDNPDQRITEDINNFTRVSLDFLVIILTSLTTLIGFVGVMWSISLPLVIVLVVYSLLGTTFTAWFGKRLIGLNFNQLRKEADFRYGLIHVRDHAESIAFYQGESRESNQVRQRFDQAYWNFDRIIAWERNISLFTNGYERLGQRLLPLIVLAPLYFTGQIKLGVITQADKAFDKGLRSLSIIVLKFEKLSEFAAGVNRLAMFEQTLMAHTPLRTEGAMAIDTAIDEKLALAHVTLETPKYQNTLVQDLSLTVPPGEGLLIVGQSGTGKSSLLRAIAGLWNAGTGRIARPRLEEMLFLPQRPYLLLGSLRDQLLYPNIERDVSEEELRIVLKQVNLANLPERVGGFDIESDLANMLSLGEQQRLAFARIILSSPHYAILDEATSALDITNEQYLYQRLQATGATYISVGHRPSLLKYHSLILELLGDSRWRVLPVAEYSSH